MKKTKKNKTVQAKAPAKKKTAPKMKNVAKKKAPVKATARKPAKTASKKPTTIAKTPAKRTKHDIFTGATEVSVTENRIAVTRTVSENVNGRYEKHEVREYHEKTAANMAALDRKLSSATTKKISVKFK